MNTQNAFIFAERGSRLKHCLAAICNQEQPVQKEGLVLGSEVVAVLDGQPCSTTSPVLPLSLSLPDIVYRSLSLLSFQEGSKEVYDLEKHVMQFTDS